ncbi:hypothetical protein [Pseudoalteromonas sp.]|uniref:hypothetical protein n=1 Tax=Pseudoalteromonas sp. TaxID=53249 RepID=UPI0026379F0F|nr:hypothetical protein [Pseudoalteromonas sp.]MCP4585396.1 hypothetical protein [Pseudoalteromonas sp.]
MTLFKTNEQFLNCLDEIKYSVFEIYHSQLLENLEADENYFKELRFKIIETIEEIKELKKLHFVVGLHNYRSEPAYQHLVKELLKIASLKKCKSDEAVVVMKDYILNCDASAWNDDTFFGMVLWVIVKHEFKVGFRVKSETKRKEHREIWLAVNYLRVIGIKKCDAVLAVENAYNKADVVAITKRIQKTKWAQGEGVKIVKSFYRSIRYDLAPIGVFSKNFEPILKKYNKRKHHN